MLNTILLWAFVVMGSINLLHLALYLVGANIYDIQRFRAQHQNKRRKPARRAKSDPLTSVKNQALASLEALLGNESVDPALKAEFLINKYREYRRIDDYLAAKNMIRHITNRRSRRSYAKELSRMKRSLPYQKKPAKLQFGGKAPLVSIIIPAHNEEVTIVRCLESIRKSTYRKFEIIVHNDHSTDATGKLVKEYQTKHPHLTLHLINRRHNVGKAEGVNHAIRTLATGDLIMTLDADCILHKRALKRTVDYFHDPNIVGVAANVRIMDHPTILGLVQKFEHLIGYRSKKLYTVINCEIIVGGVASTYRRDVLEAVGLYDTDTQTEDIGLSMKISAYGNRDQKIIYAADVVAMTEPVQTFSALLRQRYRWKLGMIQNLVKYKRLTANLSRRYSKSLTLYRIPMAFLSEMTLLFEPFLLGYLLYLSIVYRTGGLFFGAYIALTVYVLLTIWPDEHASFWRKVQMTLYAPILYFVFYIMDVVQVVAIFRVLFSPRKVLRKKATGSSWVSPKRDGQQADFV